MSRKKIAVLIASIDREYQQDFVSGLAKADPSPDGYQRIYRTVPGYEQLFQIPQD